MKNKDSSLVEQTEHKILDYVTIKGYAVDDTLPKESEFAEILGVSRVVLREALGRLRMLGFIETKKKRGTVLKNPDMLSSMKTVVNSGKLGIESVKDLFELRIMLEIGMADFIFRDKSKEGLQQLEEIVFEEEGTDVTDLEKLAKIDIKFHSTLYKMSGNKTLITFQNLLNTLFTTYSRSINWRHRQIISHASLFEILKNGTADSFRTAMRLHLNTRFTDMDTLFPMEGNVIKKE